MADDNIKNFINSEDSKLVKNLEPFLLKQPPKVTEDTNKNTKPLLTLDEEVPKIKVDLETIRRTLEDRDLRERNYQLYLESYHKNHLNRLDSLISICTDISKNQNKVAVSQQKADRLFKSEYSKGVATGNLDLSSFSRGGKFSSKGSKGFNLKGLGNLGNIGRMDPRIAMAIDAVKAVGTAIMIGGAFTTELQDLADRVTGKKGLLDPKTYLGSSFDYKDKQFRVKAERPLLIQDTKTIQALKEAPVLTAGLATTKALSGLQGSAGYMKPKTSTFGKFSRALTSTPFMLLTALHETTLPAGASEEEMLELYRQTGQNPYKAGNRTLATSKGKTFEDILKKEFGIIGYAGIMGNIASEGLSRRGRTVENTALRKMKRLGLSEEEFVRKVDSGEISRNEFLSSARWGYTKKENPSNPNLYGFGFAQWTYPSRKAKLYDEAKRRGVSISDEVLQADILIQELKAYGLYNKIKNATSVREVSDLVLTKFENPDKKYQTEAHKKLRASRGYKYYEMAKANSNITGGASSIDNLIQNKTIESILNDDVQENLPLDEIKINPTNNTEVENNNILPQNTPVITLNNSNQTSNNSLGDNSDLYISPDILFMRLSEGIRIS